MRWGARALTRLGAAAAGVLLLAGAAAAARAAGTPLATGLRRLIVADPNGGDEIGVAVWYPAAAPTVPTQLGPYRLDLAVDATPAPGARPLVVISHGTGGSAYNHHDTATALVRAGFVVAALTHPGDNFRDRSAFGTARQLFDRPPHVRAVLDAVLADPALGPAVDPARIGALGLTVPIRLYAAERDEVLRHAFNADRLRALLPRAPEFSLVEAAGHDVFLAPCPELFRREAAVVCTDPAGVNRAAVHARINAEIVAFFRRTLR